MMRRLIADSKNRVGTSIQRDGDIVEIEANSVIMNRDSGDLPRVRSLEA